MAPVADRTNWTLPRPQAEIARHKSHQQLTSIDQGDAGSMRLPPRTPDDSPRVQARSPTKPASRIKHVSRSRSLFQGQRRCRSLKLARSPEELLSCIRADLPALICSTSSDRLSRVNPSPDATIVAFLGDFRNLVVAARCVVRKSFGSDRARPVGRRQRKAPPARATLQQTHHQPSEDRFHILAWLRSLLYEWQDGRSRDCEALQGLSAGSRPPS